MLVESLSGDDLDAFDHGRALLGRTEALARQGQFAEASGPATAAIDVWERMQRKDLCYSTAYNVGALAARSDAWEWAAEFLAKAQKYATRERLPELLHRLAISHVNAHHEEEVVRGAFASCRAVAHPGLAAAAWTNEGIFCERSDPRAAIECYTQAGNLGETLFDWVSARERFAMAACQACRIESWDEADRLLNRSLAAWERRSLAAWERVDEWPEERQAAYALKGVVVWSCGSPAARAYIQQAASVFHPAPDEHSSFRGVPAWVTFSRLDDPSDGEWHALEDVLLRASDLYHASWPAFEWKLEDALPPS